ncbi:hypothetical protein WISP_96265 [Willisornis vidua]|uniref:Uncharacterized protein n=1 Tax=Willisornis vidua TaxID=1566151 RepID=A0ABQ9CZT8_9PASS|nr:hypothetical protein WISP_96265 [Willisornis vidua]
MVCEYTKAYGKAIQMINEVSSRVSPCSSVSCIFGMSTGILSVFCFALALAIFALLRLDPVAPYINFLCCVTVFAGLSTLSVAANVACNRSKAADEKLLEMSQVAGEANSLLIKNSLPVGCDSHVKLQLVYVSLAGCRRQFLETFGPSAEEMFQRALHYFSSDYACCVATKYFQFSCSESTPGHGDKGPWFCQFVSHCLKKGSWHWNSVYDPGKREFV